MPAKSLIAFAVLCASALVSFNTMAERSEAFGSYQIHYNALTTDLIDPSVARAYGIIRSKNRALINIAVLRRVMGMATQPVRAEVSAEAVNLNAQLRSIEMRELSDDGAIYYIGEIPVGHNETLNFKVEVKPADESESHTVTFSQEFFTQ